MITKDLYRKLEDGLGDGYKALSRCEYGLSRIEIYKLITDPFQESLGALAPMDELKQVSKQVFISSYSLKKLFHFSG